MVKLIGNAGNQVPTNNMLGNMAFQNKEGVAVDLLGLAAGTAAAPSLIPSGDPNTGVWFPAADTIAMSTNGSERLRIDSAGNVGIGFSAVAGQGIFQVRVASGYAFKFGQTGTSAYIAANNEAGSANVDFNFIGNNLIFSSAGAERMRLTASGNLGVGTSSPSAKLSVSDATEAKLNLLIGSVERAFINYNEANSLMRIDSDAGIILATNNAERMRIDSSGNVGIGTTTPQALLHVNGSGGIFSYLGYNYATISQLVSSADAVFGGGIICDTSVGGQLKKTVNDVAHLIKIQISDGITFHTNYTGVAGTTFARTANQRMAIDANGNVIVNTAAVATNATNGFLYVPGCAGTPTGTPTAYAGRVPIVVDTTNNKLYFYSGGAWRDAGP